MSKKNKPVSQPIPLKFDLHDLPTAQHRAGLAGLILQIDSMGREGNRLDPRLIPTIDVTPTTAKITFTQESMQGLFDNLYASKLVDGKYTTRLKKKGKDVPEDYIEEVEINGKKQKWYVYTNSRTHPLAPCLSLHTQPDASAWIDLWRRMIWEVPRGGNNVKARAPFDQRAKNPEEPCGAGAKAWTELVDFDEKVRSKNQFVTKPIAGSILLGAQAFNAESVPFSGRVDQNLLLHFWQVVVMTFVPFVVAKKDAKLQRVGYVLTIPDVANLEQFREVFPKVLGNLKVVGRGFPPQAARIDVPEQANLEVLKSFKVSDDPDRDQVRKNATRRSIRAGGVEGLNVARAAAADTALKELRSCVQAVESYHLAKLNKTDKSVKMLAFARVSDRPELIADYNDIVGIDPNTGKPRYRHPLYRASILRALVKENPWYSEFPQLFREYPWSFFIGDDPPKFLPRFGCDAKAQFDAHHQEIRDMTTEEMDDDEKRKHLGLVIRGLIPNYVRRKACRKLDLDYDKLPRKEVKGRQVPTFDDPEKFQDAQRRVCNDAFLQIRSRHDEDFVEFFAGTVCAVPHYYEKKTDDLAFLMNALMTPPSRDAVARQSLNRDDIKTLAMLALSAYSYQIRKRETKTQGSPS